MESCHKIRISKEVKDQLDELKVVERESYGDVIKRLLNEVRRLQNVL